MFTFECITYAHSERFVNMSFGRNKFVWKYKQIFIKPLYGVDYKLCENRALTFRQSGVLWYLFVEQVSAPCTKIGLDFLIVIPNYRPLDHCRGYRRHRIPEKHQQNCCSGDNTPINRWTKEAVLTLNPAWRKNLSIFRTTSSKRTFENSTVSILLTATTNWETPEDKNQKLTI